MEDQTEHGAYFSYYQALTNPINYIQKYELCKILQKYTPKEIVFVLKQFDEQVKPHVRDNLIQYATEQQRIQSSAWLIHYKNTTANLLEEEEKRLKRQWAQLNASPNSVMALKQLWSYKVLEDNTIAITKYKGEQEDVIIPSKIGTRMVTVIGKNAFFYDPYSKRDNKYAGTQNVKTVMIPEGIVKIEESAFENCHALTSVVMSDSVTTLGPYAFSNCWNLEHVTFSNNMKQIPTEAFSQCKKLKEVIFPKQLNSIDKSAFLQCESLESITIPERVTKIKNSAFAECVNLKSVEILSPDIEIMYYAFEDCINLKTLLVWGKSIKIAQGAFDNCNHIQDVTVKHKDCTSLWLAYFNKNITVHAPQNTFAMRFAHARNMKYVPLKSK